MAKCQMCGGEAGIMELCDSCQRSQAHADSERAARAVTQELADSGLGEGQSAVLIGNCILWLSLISGVACAFFFGRVTVPTGAYSTEMVWSPTIVIMCIGAGLNGAFFGYLLSKVGSVLIRLQNPAA